MDNKAARKIWVISIPLAILVATASCFGIFTFGFYANEAFNWQIQSIAQDFFNLLVVIPALLITAILSKKDDTARLLWAGVIVYLLYTFIIYCFDIHFNPLFLIYCLILGIAFFALVWFFYIQVKNESIGGIKKRIVNRITGIFFIVLSLVFYLLWISEIIPAITDNTVPQGLIETGLVTNPVHVMDLSVFLPGVFLTGLLLLKQKPLGASLSIILLTFFVLMNLTIAWLAYKMTQEGLDSSFVVTIVMSVLFLISISLLIWNILNQKNRKILEPI